MRPLQALLSGRPEVVWGLVAISVVMLVGSAVLIPVILVRFPVDYFHRERAGANAGRPPLARFVLALARNALGLVLLGAGIAMLVLPGQGLLTIAAAIALLDFPGKLAVEHWVLTRPAVFGAANRIRAWRGHPPLLAPRRR